MESREYTTMAALEDTHWWYVGLRDMLTRWLKRYLPHRPRLGPRKVLDAGCGTGRNILLTKELGYQTTGIDVSPLAIRLARKRKLRQLSVGSVTKLPFRARTFDGVLCIDVLGSLSLPAQRQALREFWRILKPGGIVILHLAAIDWLFSPHDTATHNTTRFTTKKLLSLTYPSPQATWIVRHKTYRYFLLFPLMMLLKRVKLWWYGDELPKSDLAPTPTWINAPLSWLAKLENAFAARWRLPIGSSLAVVLQKQIALPQTPHLPSLTIFFPFFNDAGTVQTSISAAYAYGSQLTKDLEVIALHGGPSRDNTYQEILAAQRRYPSLRILNHEHNREGYAVIKHGLRAARKAWVFYTDGDLQYDVALLNLLVAYQNQTLADVVNGYKLRRQDDWLRTSAGFVYRLVCRFAFGLPVRDPDCDFRLIRTSFLRRFTLTSTSASILPELIHRLATHGAEFTEVAVSHFPRQYGQSNYTVWQLFREKIVGDVRLWFQLKMERKTPRR